MLHRILRLFIFCLLTTSLVRAQHTPNLVVAWVENGDLWVWRAADNISVKYTSGSILTTVISPDGQYIAYTTADPGTLWLITPDNPDPIEVVPNNALAKDTPQFMNINNLQWGTNHTLFFDTYFLSTSAGAQYLDLWSVDAASLTYKQLFPQGEGGLFTLSPDARHIALVQPGTYDGAEGSIRILDSANLNELNKFFFHAVSGASNRKFSPQINWLSDGQSLKVAIPDKDLVYADDTAMTSLWQLGLEGSQTHLGDLQASYFGLPQWSDDGKYLTYMRHKGDISSNLYEIIVTDDASSNPEVYASDSAGNLGNPGWIPDSQQFFYVHADQYWVGQPAVPATALIKTGVFIKFVNNKTYVFAGLSDDVFGVFYGSLDSTTSTRIALAQTTYLTFDAVLVP